MKIEIKNRWNDSLIFSGEFISVKLAVEYCIATRISLRNADLSGADLSGADLSGAILRAADLRGVNLSGADLNTANLNTANLSDANLSGANLRDATLRDTDLSDANLSGTNLSNADLSDAPFAVPHLDAKILERIQSGGRLEVDCWHSCDTSHCRAGWAVVVAGPAGRALEWMQGTRAAASLIYAASRPKNKIPDFAAELDNEEVLNDIKKCAAADPLPN